MGGLRAHLVARAATAGAEQGTDDGGTMVIDGIADRGGDLLEVRLSVYDRDGDRVQVDGHRFLRRPPVTVVDGSERPAELLAGGRVLVTPGVRLDPVGALWDALAESVRVAPNPEGFGRDSTVLTAYGESGDGGLDSYDASWSIARAGSGTIDTKNYIRAGDFLNEGASQYHGNEGFCGFDTSSIPDSATVTAAVLSLYLHSWYDDPDDVEVRDHNWGGSITTGDWVAGASLSSSTLLATYTGPWDTAEYKDYSSESAMLSATNMKTGTVRMITHGTDLRVGTSPVSGTDKDSYWYTDTVGSNEPKLTVTYTTAVPAGSPLYRQMRRRARWI